MHLLETTSEKTIGMRKRTDDNTKTSSMKATGVRGTPVRKTRRFLYRSDNNNLQIFRTFRI